MRIGLYFGSFNPIHNGHLSIAQQMLHKVGFDEVWLVVSPQNPLKDDAELAPEQDRVAMVRLALADEAAPIRACDVELSLPRPSYTISTLGVLAQSYPNDEFSVIMGSDNLAVIERWRSYRDILDSYGVFFFPRLGDSSDELAGRYGATKVDGDYLDISSTQIRERLQHRESIEGLVPVAVERYINEKKLYEKGAE